MAKVRYKKENGILHIGGGRFFYGRNPVTVSDDEVDSLLASYEDLELVQEEEETPAESELHTKTSIKKLSADEQRGLIVELGGNPEETNNEDERVDLILQLQKENEEESE